MKHFCSLKLWSAILILVLFWSILFFNDFFCRSDKIRFMQKFCQAAVLPIHFLIEQHNVYYVLVASGSPFVPFLKVFILAMVLCCVPLFILHDRKSSSNIRYINVLFALKKELVHDN